MPPSNICNSNEFKLGLDGWLGAWKSFIKLLIQAAGKFTSVAGNADGKGYHFSTQYRLNQKMFSFRIGWIYLFCFCS